MRFIIAILLIAGISLLTGPLTPWWFGIVVAFLVTMALVRQAVPAFFAGFLGCFIYWSSMAMLIDSGNDQILSEKIIQLFGLPNTSLLILATGLIGAIPAGFGSLSGFFLYSALRKTN